MVRLSEILFQVNMSLKHIWIVLLFLLIIGTVEATTITENTDMGWETLIEQNYTSMSSIPDNIYLSNPVTTGVLVSNQSINLTSGSGLMWNGTKPTVGSLFIGQLYPGGRTRYIINMTLNRTGSTYSSMSLLFGLEGQIGFYTWGATTNYAELQYYNSTGAYLHGEPLYTDTKGNTFNFTIDFYPNGSMTLSNTTSSLTQYFNYPSFENVPYSYLSPTLIQMSIGFGGSATGVNYTINEFRELVPKKLITVLPNNNSLAFGFDGARNNFSYGADWLQSRGYKATIWEDVAYYNLTSANVTTRELVLDYINNKSWELGIHFNPELDNLSLAAANSTIDTEFNNITSWFGTPPLSWCSLRNADNSSHAVYAYNNYSMVWRNSPFSIRTVGNVGNIDDESINWWNDSSSHRSFIPTFTHSVSDPAESSSLSIGNFTSVMNTYINNGTKIIPYAQWYYENNNTVQPITNVYFSPNNSYFNINTTGYNATTTIYDPNGEGIWHATGSTITTTIDNTNETNLSINTPSNLTVTKANATIIPSSGNVTVSVNTWNTSSDYYKKFNASDGNFTAIVGDFPHNARIQIKLNGTNSAIVNTNSTGYLVWNYTGEAGETQFKFNVISTGVGDGSISYPAVAVAGVLGVAASVAIYTIWRRRNGGRMYGFIPFL